jgi:hypothetical protein
MGPNRYIVLGLALFMVSFAGFAQELRDPTRPQAGVPDKAPRSGTNKSKPRSKMVLQTVLIGEDRQSAVISGRLMSVGDTISGFRLSEIRAGEVVLLKGRSKTRTLRLFPDVHLSDVSMANPSEKQKAQR